jgi:hypothetical protein
MMLFDKVDCQALNGLDLVLDANEYVTSVEMRVRDGYTMSA